MRERGLTIPEIAVIGGTRAALGAGIGLLISDRLNKDQRKGAGWAPKYFTGYRWIGFCDLPGPLSTGLR